MGGIAKAETFGQIIDMAESFGEDDWRQFLREIQYAQPGEFFLFEHAGDRPGRAGRASTPNLANRWQSRRPSKEVTLGYRFSRLVHGLAFTRGKGLYGLMRRSFARWDEQPGLMRPRGLLRGAAVQEICYGCQDCGDCSLPDCAYLCPRHDCSEGARNGPCGGSCGGRCELDDKECLWARVYERLKNYGESETWSNGRSSMYNLRIGEHVVLGQHLPRPRPQRTPHCGR